MEKKCYNCNIEVGKCCDGTWIYYSRDTYFNRTTRCYNMVYLCINCQHKEIYWKCTKCREIITDSNIEFCVQPQNTKYFLKTCVQCLNKIREDESTDLICNCLICSEINDNHTFIPK